MSDTFNPRRSAQSAHLKADVELSCVALHVLGWCEYQLLSSATEDEIRVVRRAAASPAVVGGLLLNLIGDRFIEVKLRSELLSTPGVGTGAYFEVDVDGSSHIQARIDRQELDDSVCVRRLISAEKFLACCIEPSIHVANARVNTESVTLPNVNDGAADRLAGAAVNAGNLKR